MSKPVLPVDVTTPAGETVTVAAVLDSGSYYTLIRQDRLPADVQMIPVTRVLRAAAKRSQVRILGLTHLVVKIGAKLVEAHAHISPDLSSEMLIGAETMQAWDISLVNTNGKTEVTVGHDMRDPEITEVD